MEMLRKVTLRATMGCRDCARTVGHRSHAAWMKTMCKHLDFPVVSGNVSLYNQTGENNILPTPVIGAVGLIENYEDQDGDHQFPW